MPTINLTDDELVAVTATVRRAIEDDRFPHAPRLDPLRAALGKFEAAPAPTSLAKAPPPAKADKRRGDNRRPFARRRYLRPSIHSVSACEPRPSAASMAVLYPCRAWSLDTTPLVTGSRRGRRASSPQRRRSGPCPRK
jgi:hypothetical protein